MLRALIVVAALLLILVTVILLSRDQSPCDAHANAAAYQLCIQARRTLEAADD